ncbi:DNA-directed RNA polymerase III subunit RPC3-like [Pyrus ussuriensis x Pyrus communis]|uniref:DNA-directed RNA polymerase III subunit RPC3-like n=1 Tax=Pyrus ussuriensis x Pyrus communis TaxID=2448454 RepID=A0A5N5I9H8_9ROSA|nr:DNA-directed RNA polymerase III subunit RPC3-like [Pyrus ussuriensis x Pyrus communis]
MMSLEFLLVRYNLPTWDLTGGLPYLFSLKRATFEESVRCLKHKACVENVRARRLDDDGAAALVLREMLKSTRTAGKKVQTENSVPLSISTIYEEAINSEAGHTCLCDGERDVDDEDDESDSTCQLEENS